MIKKLLVILCLVASPVFAGEGTLGERSLQSDTKVVIGVYFSPNGGCQEAIISEIDQADTGIDVAMYYFTSKPLAEALVEAEKRGVEVRIYLDESQEKQKYSRARELEAFGCEVRFEDGSGLMHNKFCVIDGETLITGSYNWTKAAETRNDENVLIIFSGEAVKMFEEQFERMWGGDR